MHSLIFVLMFVFGIVSAESTDTSIKAVVFDFGGVLMYPDKAPVLAFVSQSFDITQDQAQDVISRFKKYWGEGGTEENFWNAYAKESGKQLSHQWLERWHTTLLNSLKEIPGTVAIVKELKQQGFRVALFSNVKKNQADEIRKLSYYNLFDPLILSYEIGVDKPDPKAYQILLKTLDLPASACLFIDDKKENVEAARAIGIDSIQFVNAEELVRELDLRGIHVDIHSLTHR